MPQPSRSDVHVNGPLTNISTAYIQNESDFIAGKVLPMIPVSKQSDLFFQYPKGEWFRSEVTERAPSTESAGSGYSVTSSQYLCKKYSVHKDIDDDVIANADSPLDMERDTTMFVSQQVLLHREQMFLDKFMSGSAGWTNPGNPTVLWDSQSTATPATPIQDITSAALTMTSKTGFRPNTLVLAPKVYLALKNCPQILGRIIYTQKGIATTALLAELFDVQNVFVSYAVKNSAKEGATDSLDFAKSTGALLCYVNPNPSIMQPSAGYTFAWSGLYGASAYGSRIKRFRQESINSVRIEAESAFTQEIIGTDLGAYWQAPVT